MSIQERNRYKKEIDILINRLSILQEQEKTYNDLTKEIASQKQDIEGLQKKKKNLTLIIDSKTHIIECLAVKTKEEKDNYTKVEKKLEKANKEVENEIKRYSLQQEAFEKHLTRIQGTINKNNIKLEETKIKLKAAEDEYYNYVLTVKRDKWALFDKVMNNEKILEEQEAKIAKLKKDEKSLKLEYKELDNEYQTLLENYIIKQ